MIPVRPKDIRGKRPGWPSPTPYLFTAMLALVILTVLGFNEAVEAQGTTSASVGVKLHGTDQWHIGLSPEHTGPNARAYKGANVKIGIIDNGSPLPPVTAGGGTFPMSN